MKRLYSDMKNFFALIFLPLLAANALAKEPYVDLRDVNLKGKVVEISAPNILKVETLQDGERRHFWVEMIYVDFGKVANKSCQKKTIPHKLRDRITPDSIKHTPELEKACDRIDDWLDGEPVQVEVTEWDQPILKGYVFHKSVNVNHELIAKGWYPVDYKQTRDANLALLEKRARCQRVGIWKSKMGIPEEDLKCQD
jgi:endonuclease YncB( thermonuclease family)